MSKKCLAILLLFVLCMAGCGKKTTVDDAETKASEKSVVSEENSTYENETKSEDKTEKDQFDSSAEFPDLLIGDTVCVETAGVEEPYQYKFTLNSVEYADGEINGASAEGHAGGFIVIDVTLEGIGPDVSYGIVFSQTYIGRLQFYPEHQSEYGLNTFSDPDAVLAKGEKITGRIAVWYDKVDLVVEKYGVLTTKFQYTVEESEIKDYVPGEQ